jgi:hypothetical protein
MDEHEKALVRAGVEAAVAALDPHDRDEQGLRWAKWLQDNAAKIADKECERISSQRAALID